MVRKDPENQAEQTNSKSEDVTDDTASAQEIRPKEIGGRNGPDPTRYGDWEKAGRCIDF